MNPQQALKIRQASRWCFRRDGAASPAEDRRFYRWLRADPEHLEVLLRQLAYQYVVTGASFARIERAVAKLSLPPEYAIEVRSVEKGIQFFWWRRPGKRQSRAPNAGRADSERASYLFAITRHSLVAETRRQNEAFAAKGKA